MKKFLICTVPIVIIFLVSPIFYMDNYLGLYFDWNTVGEATLPFIIRILPALAITIVFLVFRLKKADLIEITFASITITASFLFFTLPFIRYFQPILIFGILKKRSFFSFTLLGFIKREINFDNNLLVFYSSFLLVAGAYLIIVFLL